MAAVTAGPNVIRLSNSEPIELEEWNHAGLTIDGGQIRLIKWKCLSYRLLIGSILLLKVGLVLEQM